MGDGEINKPIKLEKLKVTYKGVFNMKNLYKFLHDWLEEEGFKADGAPSGGDMWESFYWERRTAQGFTDYNIWWRMKKSPDYQSSAWIDYKLNLDFLGIAIGKTDVMHEGKKISAYNGELNMSIIPKVVVDENKLWNKDSLVGKFSKVFLNRTYKKEIKFHKDYMNDVAFRLQEAIKNFLGLSTFGDYGESFHPEKGFGWA